MQVDLGESVESHEKARLPRLRTSLVVFWLLMFLGTHIKLSDGADVLQVRDKVLHFAGYAGLAFLLIAYQRSRKGIAGWGDFLGVWVLAASYGIADELTQIPVGRSCDPLDWLADVAGAATGLLAFVAVRRLVPRMALLGK